MPEQETLLAEQFPGPGRFGNAFLAQIDIRPSRKTVFPVPCALAVAEQNYFFILSLFRFGTHLVHQFAVLVEIVNILQCSMRYTIQRFTCEKPWCEVMMTLLNDSRRARMSSSMIRSEVSS